MTPFKMQAKSHKNADKITLKMLPKCSQNAPQNAHISISGCTFDFLCRPSNKKKKNICEMLTKVTKASVTIVAAACVFVPQTTPM